MWNFEFLDEVLILVFCFNSVDTSKNSSSLFDSIRKMLRLLFMKRPLRTNVAIIAIKNGHKATIATQNGYDAILRDLRVLRIFCGPER